MRGAEAPEGQLGLIAEQVSHFSSSSSSDTQIFQDGETTVLSLDGVWRRGGLALGFEAPWLRHSGGSLDRFIDNFHRTFNLPEGGRDRAPRDRLDFLLRVDGETEASLMSSTSGLGDLRLWAGGQLVNQRRARLAWRAQLKLPTGEADELLGSGATDLAAWLELGLDGLPLGLDLTGGFGAVWLGEGDIAGADQERSTVLAHLGLQRRFGRWLVTAQADAHGPLFDLSVDQLGDEAVLGSLGISRTLGERHRFTLLIVEDLVSQSTSDVAFQLRWQAGVRAPSR